MMLLTFPWPQKALNPNARVHWTIKYTAAKLYKGWCIIACKDAKLTKVKADRVNLAVIFSPPDNRIRDLDNCIASAKWLFDGISEAIGIDDSKFECTYKMAAPVKHGSVTVDITWRTT